VTVHEDLAGIDFALAPSLFPVTGRVTDGLSGVGLAEATIAIPYVASTVTNSTGNFSFDIPNGTYSAHVTPQVGQPDLPATFTLVVNGARVERELALYPAGTILDGLVANAVSGLPIRGATVAVSGTTAGGAPWSAKYQANSLGRVTILVYAGEYSINATAAGYFPTTSPITTTGGGSVPLVLALNATGTGLSSPPPPPGWTFPDGAYVAGIAAVAAIAILGLFIGTRRRSPTYYDAEPDNPVDAPDEDA
jgi:hypothetical protein